MKTSCQRRNKVGKEVLVALPAAVRPRREDVLHQRRVPFVVLPRKPPSTSTSLVLMALLLLALPLLRLWWYLISHTVCRSIGLLRTDGILLTLFLSDLACSLCRSIGSFPGPPKFMFSNTRARRFLYFGYDGLTNSVAWLKNWSPGLFAGAICTVFQAGPVWKGLGVEFAFENDRPSTKTEKHFSGLTGGRGVKNHYSLSLGLGRLRVQGIRVLAWEGPWQELLFAGCFSVSS